MWQRFALVVIIMSVAGLAGCTGVGTGPDGRTGDSSTDADSEAASGAQAATRGAHAHDTWGAATAITLFDDRVEARGSVNATSSLEMPDGAVVFPGTASVSITAEWSNRLPTETKFGIHYRAADGTEGWVATPSGRTVWISANETMNDAAHSRQTVWQFDAWITGAYGEIEADLFMEILRVSGPLPVAPAHPDRWQGASSLILLDTAGELQDLLGYGGFVWPDSQPPNRLEIRPVPWETMTLEIRFHYNSSTPPEVHYRPDLSWHGADRREDEAGDVPPTESDIQQKNGLHRWILDVEPRMWDSPYVEESSWSIQFHRGGQMPDVNGAVPVWMDGEFHIVVAASK